MLIKQKKTNQSTDTILRNLSRKIIQDMIVILKSFSFVNAIYVFFVCENGYINALTRTHVKNLKRRRKYPEQITIQRWKSLLLDWKQIGSSSLFNRSKWIIKALGILRFVFFSYFPNIIIVFFLFLQLWCCSLIMSLRKNLHSSRNCSSFLLFQYYEDLIRFPSTINYIVRILAKLSITRILETFLCKALIIYINLSLFSLHQQGNIFP